MESNPLKLDEMFRDNLILELMTYKRLISIKLTNMDQIKLLAGYQKPKFLQFLEIPSINIQHNNKNLTIDDTNFVLP